MLEANLALEVGFRIVVYIEDDGGLVALQGEALGRREIARVVERGAPSNLEIDRGFGESAEEIAVGDASADECGQEPKQQNAQVTRLRTFGLGSCTMSRDDKLSPDKPRALQTIRRQPIYA